MIISKYNEKLVFILVLLFYHISTNKNIENNKIINSQFLSNNKKDHFTNQNNKSLFNGNHIRYHFQEKFNNMKQFKINYSFEPYINLSTNLTFDENVNYIYNKTGMLNITKLENYILKKQSNINISQLNHIHISMSFNKNYTDLALISIASILNTSNFNTYIHFHILGLNFSICEIRKIINLRKINNQVEFIFYNAKQAEYDFEIGLKDRRGIGNYAKILIPQIINGTNKILILDSGDILCQKDLSELYFYDIEDNYFGWVLDQNAGNQRIKVDKFMTNYFHPNTGVFLVNIELFKKDELYKKAVFMSKSYNNFVCPTQDILITISYWKFKYIPLKFNIHDYYKNKEEETKKIRTKRIRSYLKLQMFSPYKYSVNEIYDAMSNPVIIHFYNNKIQKKTECDKIVIQWLSYAKLAGVYSILKQLYPNPFSCEKYLQI